MATGVQSWSQTAASNNTADSNVNWAEGMAPSAVNDSARAMMASVAKWRDELNGTNATTGGTTAYVLTSDQTFAALAAGLEVAFQINATNTGTTTLNVDSLGAKPLRSAAGVELLAGSLYIGAVYRATYFTSNSGEWLIHGYPVLGDAQIAAAKLASNAVTTAKILDANVTLAKMADLATKTAIGRNTGSTGVPEAVTIAQQLNWLGTPARGDIIRQGAANPERLALGTSGYVLTSDGTDATWASPKIVRISQQSASSSATIDFTGLSSTYRLYRVELEGVVPATDGAQLQLLVSEDGSSWKATSYLSMVAYVMSNGTGNTAAGNPTTYIPLSGTGGAGVSNVSGCGGWSGAISIETPSDTARKKQIHVERGGYLMDGDTIHAFGLIGGGSWNGGNAALTALRFQFSTGNIASGKFTIFGII